MQRRCAVSRAAEVRGSTLSGVWGTGLLFRHSVAVEDGELAPARTLRAMGAGTPPSADADPKRRTAGSSSVPGKVKFLIFSEMVRARWKGEGSLSQATPPMLGRLDVAEGLDPSIGLSISLTILWEGTKRPA